MSLSDSKRLMEYNTTKSTFGDDYKLQVFMLWYNAGKPRADLLINMLEPDPTTGNKPILATLRLWVHDIFIPKAVFLDEQVATTIDNKMIAQRIEMADRHAQIGRQLQEKGLAYLLEHEITNARDALASVIKGVEIEHDARVLPTDMLGKLEKMTDDQIYAEFKKVLQTGPILDITPYDSNDEKPTTPEAET